MPVSPARETAYRILSRVESGRDYAVDLLQSPQVSDLGERDRGLATQIVMGTLRRRGDLDHWLVKLSGKKLTYFDSEVATVLRLSLYQILFLEKIPKSAVVNEAVELVKAARKRSAAGLVNAVLRKCEAPRNRARPKPRAGKSDHVDGETVASGVRSLPAWLADRWEQHFGTDARGRLAGASLSVPHTTLRLDGNATAREQIRLQLIEMGISTRPGLYSGHALVVDSVEAGNAQSSPIVREGRAVIQDEASQLVALLVSPRPGDRVLDLCAAPGIKIGQLAAAMGTGLIVAGDLSARRLRTMRELLSRSTRFQPVAAQDVRSPQSTDSLPRLVDVPPVSESELHLHVVRLDAARELPFGMKFERILLDAPCSGTGTLARNPEIKWRLQPKDLVRLAGLQVKMLQAGLSVLAPGGRLVYSTCSLEPEENEEVVERVLQSNPRFQLLPAADLAQEFPGMFPLFDDRGYFHTRPDLQDMDGFFAAVICPMQ